MVIRNRFNSGALSVHLIIGSIDVGFHGERVAHQMPATHIGIGIACVIGDFHDFCLFHVERASEHQCFTVLAGIKIATAVDELEVRIVGFVVLPFLKFAIDFSWGLVEAVEVVVMSSWSVWCRWEKR